MLKMKLTMKLPSNMAVTESSLREIGTVSGRVGFYRPQLVPPRNGQYSSDVKVTCFGETSLKWTILQ